MSLKRILGMTLAVCLVVPLSACDDTTKPEPPPLPPQITTNIHYTKTFSDKGVQTGLQSNDVYDILVESVSGRLWIGNQAGIAVYDGFSTVFRSDAFDQNGQLPNPKVRVMVELDGKIYVGTWGGGIGVYDIGGDTWSILDTGSGLVNDLVSDIQIDDGKLVIATAGGVSHYDPVADTWASYKKEPGENTKGDLLDQFVSVISVAQTPRGKEYWYCPRWESGIDPGTEDEHGITIARGVFDAAPVTLTLDAIRDNTLYENAAGSLSNALGEHVLVGMGADGLIRKGLILFDVFGVVPTDATVSSVKLLVRNTLSGFAPAQVSLHRALADWGESTSLTPGDEILGAPATVGDATWLHTFYDNSFWVTPGGDYAVSPSGTIEIRGTGNYSWRRELMIDDIQFWVRNPGTNFGWVIVSTDSLKSLASRQFGAVASRPQLEIKYAKYSYLTTESSDLPEPNVNDIFYDETDDLFWLAFSTKGLATVDVESSTWKVYTTSHGLPSNIIYSIAQVNGVIWVATQNGIARHLGGGRFQGYARSGGIPADRVRRVGTDDGTRLWLSLIVGGAARVDPDSAE